MSVEKKIKELLNRASGAGQLAEEKSLDEASATAVAADGKVTVNVAKDTSKSGVGSGDSEAQPMQGSSKKADTEEVLDATGKNTAAAKMSKEAYPAMKGDAKTAKTQAMEEIEEDGETIAEDQAVDIKSQLDAIFGQDLSEDFRTKASSIFEAAVIARVNSEMEKVTTKLEEQSSTQLLEFKEALVEKVDGYLNYVVEQWMEENKLAVESGLRTEIAEDFISGMKTLFQEHYIEVPEEKYNLIDDLQAQADEFKSKLDESIDTNVALSQELNALKRAKVIEEQTKDLAATEAEKLKKLVEGVDFESEDLYREKVAVIKENYFPKAAKTSPESVLVEESGTNPTAFADNSMMSKYVSVLSRSVKSR